MNKVNPLDLGPIVKGVEEDLSSTFVRIWGKANPSKQDTFLVVRIATLDAHTYSEPIYLQVRKENDYCGVVEISGLEPDTTYTYQMGYVTGSTNDLIWPKTVSGRFKTSGEKNLWNFCFGSCRLHAKVAGSILFGSGESTDEIYRIIKDQDPEFWLEIGDQVYFDYLGFIARAKSLADMRARYRVREYPHQAYLYANKPVYSMCDDHDLHRNNTDYVKKTEEPEVWANGLKTFREYQSLKGPDYEVPLWYWFTRHNATFFVCDSRSERQATTIISDDQMDAIQDWLRHPDHTDKYKFFVSPTPVISQINADSWFGYPLQQRRLIEMLLSFDHTYILTGDAHCARTGTYSIYDENGVPIGQLTEILSSGLCAAASDQGKYFDRTVNANVPDYDRNNDFPMVLDNSTNGGVKIVTDYSSPCYPGRHSSLVKHFTYGDLDHVVTDVVVTPEALHVRVLNHKGELLNKLILDKDAVSLP